MSAQSMRETLLPIFLEELEGQVAQFAAELPPGTSAPAEPKRLKALFRVAHTLKGAAHAMGVVPIERLCRSLEVTLSLVGEGGAMIAPDHYAFLVASADALRDAGARLRAGQELTHAPVAALAARGPK
jgi:two-component system chemotaxis sensor kinase CheA